MKNPMFIVITGTSRDRRSAALTEVLKPVIQTNIKKPTLEEFLSLTEESDLKKVFLMQDITTSEDLLKIDALTGTLNLHVIVTTTMSFQELGALQNPMMIMNTNFLEEAS